jgi:hypothetical protein
MFIAFSILIQCILPLSLMAPALSLTSEQQSTEIEAFSTYLLLYNRAEKAETAEEATEIIEKFVPLIADSTGYVPDHVKAHSLIAIGRLYEEKMGDPQTAYLAYTQASDIGASTVGLAARAVALERMASMERQGVIDPGTGKYTFKERYRREFLPTFGWKGAGPMADKAITLTGLSGRNASVAKFLSTFAWVAGSNAGSGVIEGSLQGIDDVTDVIAESAVDSMGRTVGDGLVEKTARKSVEKMSYGRQLASFGVETAAMAGSRILADAAVDMYRDHKSGAGVNMGKSFAQVDYRSVAAGSAGWVGGSMVGKAAGALVGGLLGTMVGAPAIGAVVGSAAVGRMGGVLGMAVGEAFSEESRNANPNYAKALLAIDFHKLAARAAASVTVGMGVSAIGKMAGGAIGGLAGSLICPGAGTAAGIAAGSFLGGVIGDVAGFVAGGAMADTIVDKYRASRDGRDRTLKDTQSKSTQEEALLRQRVTDAYQRYVSLLDASGPSSENTAAAFDEYRKALKEVQDYKNQHQK